VKLGWIGAGRMGFEMARRLAKAGCDITVWNRTRAKAEPLAKDGAKIADGLPELAGCGIVFCMVSTYDDVKEVIAGPKGLLSGSARPKMVVECSSISLEGSAELRKILSAKGVELLSAPVSGNAKVIKAGKLTFVVSGPKSAYDTVAPYLDMMGQGSSYVGEGELSRIVKICHNVMLGVVTQCMAEITVLAQKAGVPRHAFLDFLNKSVMGSTFTRYKLEVPMPLASITRDLIQSMMGAGMTEEDFSALLLQQAKASGIELKPENKAVGDGLSQ
jgi:3-hydroxyisobutyrate dehydrogenase-like beta-hydroxyacid dehydrogenase